MTGPGTSTGTGTGSDSDSGSNHGGGGIVLAVDGGNVKTDLALVHTSGRLLALVRGGRSSPHYEGVEGCVRLLEGLLAEAISAASLDGAGRLEAAIAEVMIAGADLPEELAAVRTEIDARGWTGRLAVDNDTFALLRSGTDRGWGVAVVCGGGINCVGLAPDGRRAGFPALGPITGDWGGGYDVGIAALMAAARSADGRGPKTVLETAVPAHYGFAEPFDVARAVHLRELPLERIGELARVVFPAAQDDPVAASIVRHQTDEVVTLATVAIGRLGLADRAPDVVLGGGLIRAASPDAIAAIVDGIREAAPSARVTVASSAPIVGAVLLGLDALGVDANATARARREVDEAFSRIEGDGSRVTAGQHTGDSPTAQALLRNAHG